MKTQLAIYVGEIRNVASKGFFHLFTAQGIVFVVGFLSQFFVAGFLDPTDIGRIKIMQTYLGFFALLSGLGFDHSLLKLASENKDENQRRTLYQTAFVITLLTFVFLYLLLYSLALLGIMSSDPVISSIFPLYSLFLLPSAIQQIQLAYYQARKQVKKLAGLQVIVKAISIIFIVVCTWFFQLNGYIFTVVITGFFSIIVLEMGIRNFRFKAAYFQLDKAVLRKMWRMAGFALLTNMLGMLSQTVDIYLINYMVTDRQEVGYYMFALTILSVLQLFPTTIQQVAFPFFSERSSNYERWYSSYVKYNKLNHLLILSIVTASIMILPFFIRHAFAGKYDRSIHYFIFLAFAWMIKFSNIMKATAIMGRGRFDINFRASAVSVLLTSPVVFAGIYFAGLDGAVMGMIAGAIISYLTYRTVFYRFNKQLMSQPATV